MHINEGVGLNNILQCSVNLGTLHMEMMDGGLTVQVHDSE